MTNAFSFKIKWPVDKSEKEIRVEPDYYKFLNIYRPNKFLNLATVHEVLNYPNRIFAGLNRPHSDSSRKLCVVGKPHNWYIGKDDNSVSSFPTNYVYVVFLSERFSIFEFRAEQADLEDPLSPVGWRDRFGELLWKIHS